MKNWSPTVGFITNQKKSGYMLMYANTINEFTLLLRSIFFMIIFYCTACYWHEAEV